MWKSSASTSLREYCTFIIAGTYTDCTSHVGRLRHECWRALLPRERTRSADCKLDGWISTVQQIDGGGFHLGAYSLMAKLLWGFVENIDCGLCEYDEASSC